MSTVVSLACLVKLSVEGVQIEEQVDTPGGKGTHACIMIRTRVYMIDAYSIGPQLCHRGSIERTLSCVGERIEGGELVGNSCARCQKIPHTGWVRAYL